MAIDFSLDRWQAAKDTYHRWWAHELDRPLILAEGVGRDPGRPEPTLPACAFTAFHDLSVPAEQIVDRWDYDLSCREFLGDSYPRVWPNFGPGVLAAFLGARPESGADTVWFHPPADRPIDEIHFEYDPDSIWLERIKDICRAAVDRWQGTVQIGMTDLGGNLDILSTFRPAEGLLLDLYDRPDQVKRLLWEAHEFWHRCYGEINEILRPANPGYTAWDGVFSERPYYMLQCDFCYMISPEMFDEFVRPELAASCRRLANSIYHLDGPGQLPHLDSLLSIDRLGGVQWVPGAGRGQQQDWLDVLCRIRSAGKLVWIAAGYRGLEYLDRIAERLGSAAGAVVVGAGSDREALDALARYGVA